MKFGKLANVDQVDWEIPPDDPLSQQLLVGSSPGDFLLYYGAPAWGHKAWLGKIYPLTVKREEFLVYYSRQFNCIELNTTHYRIPDQKQIQRWTEQVPKEFLFCPKIYQGLSHRSRGLLDRSLLQRWLKFLSQLGDHCGPCFLQLPPFFGYAMKAELFNFLENWPSEFSLALEFRHPSWFEEGKVRPALVHYLHKRGISLVMTDVAGHREVLHTSLSTDFCLLRFVGNELHPTDYLRAKAWCERLQTWREYGLRKLFLFIHEPDDISVPEMTDYFLKELRDHRLADFRLKAHAEPQLTLGELS